MPKFYMAIGALTGLMSVILGAFGAHALKDKLSTSLLATYQTGVQYQMYHALALLVVGVMLRTHPQGLLHTAGGLFVSGIVLFSGSLYLLALGAPRWLGPVTPLGGLCFIAGWLLLFIAVMKN